MSEPSDTASTPIGYWTLIAESREALEEKLRTDPREAARWVEAAAHNGSKPAIVNWGQMLLDGHGVGRDPAAALRWFRIAAEVGHLDAINMVGRCYELGLGVVADPAEAARHYRTAADAGHAWARFNLGGLLLQGGVGAARDPAAALALFVRSARQGNAKAMNMIGRFREEGWHGPVKLRAAMRWYARAAARGCFRGQFHLARFLFAQGQSDEAEHWLRESIGQAPPDFCREAAAMLVAHSSESLRQLGLFALRRACESGRHADFLDYARALEDERIAPPRPADALEWLLRAARRGSVEASADLKRRGVPLPRDRTFRAGLSARLRAAAAKFCARAVREVRLALWRLREATRFGARAADRPEAIERGR